MKAAVRIVVNPPDVDNIRHQSARERTRRDKRWSLFVARCQEYAESGMEYETRYSVSESMTAHVTVRASGTLNVKRRRVVDVPKPYRDKGRPLTVEQCRKRRIEAQTRVNDPVQTDINAMADLEFYQELERLAAERADGQQRGRRVERVAA